MGRRNKKKPSFEPESMDVDSQSDEYDFQNISSEDINDFSHQFATIDSISSSSMTDIYKSANKTELQLITSKLKNATNSDEKISALRKLSSIFSVSNEENLLSSTPIILQISKLLLEIINYSEEAEECLLSIRSIANLIEAQPGITSYLVDQNLVLALCNQLLQLQDIDIADQVLTTLEAISRDFPKAIIDAGGMVAAMCYIDFFTTSSQRTALQIVTNSISGITNNDFQNFSQVMPHLIKTVVSSDNKVAELSWVSMEIIVKNTEPGSQIESIITHDFIAWVISEYIQNTNSSTRKQLLRILGLISHKSQILSLQILNSNIFEQIHKNYISDSGNNNDKIPLDNNTPTSSLKNNTDLNTLEEEWEVLGMILGLLPPLHLVVDNYENGFNIFTIENNNPNKTNDSNCYSKILYSIQKNKDQCQKIMELLIFLGIYLMKSESSEKLWNRSMVAVLLAVWLFDPKDINKIFEKPKFAYFVPWFISHGHIGDHSSLISSLMLGYKLLEKANDNIKLTYERQGAVYALRKLSGNSSYDASENMFTQGVKLLYAYLQPTNISISNNKPTDETKIWIGKLSSLILKTHWPYSSNNDLESSPESIMCKLHLSAQNTQNLWYSLEESNEHLLIPLIENFKLQLASTDGVTVHELEHSGWLELFSEMSDCIHSSKISINSEKEKNQNFDENTEKNIIYDKKRLTKKSPSNCQITCAYKVFECLLNTSKINNSQKLEEYSISTLIGLINESLIIHEELPTFIPTRSSEESKNNGLVILARSLKVQLTYLDNDDYSTEIDQDKKNTLEKIYSDLRAKVKSLRINVLGSSQMDSLLIDLKPQIVRVLNSISETPLTKLKIPERSVVTDFLPVLSDQNTHLENLLLSLSNARSSANQFLPEIVDPESVLSESNSKDSSVNPIDSDTQKTSLSTFDLKNFKIEIFLEKELNGKLFKLDMTKSLYSSLLSAYFNENTKTYDEFSPWSTIFNLKYKVIFTENLPKTGSETNLTALSDINLNSFETVRSLSYALAAKQRQSLPTFGQNILRVHKYSYKQALDIFDNKIAHLLNVLLGLYNTQLKIFFLNPNAFIESNNNTRWEHTYINNKINNKLGLLVNDPFTIASKSYPEWTYNLVYHFPFLFTFEYRSLFLRTTCLPPSRNLSQWNSRNSNASPDSSNRENRTRTSGPVLGIPIIDPVSHIELSIQLPQLRKQKVMVNRSRIFESAMQTMMKYSHPVTILEVQYIDEAGTGLGPTLEFYSSVCTEFLRKSLKMWYPVCDKSQPESPLFFAPKGLFPLPISTNLINPSGEYAKLFSFLGTFVAKAIIDERPLDLPLHPAFLMLLLNSISETKFPLPDPLVLIELIDTDISSILSRLQNCLAEKLRIYGRDDLSTIQKNNLVSLITLDDGSLIDDLCIDFTLIGCSDYLLRPNGGDVSVNILNLQPYLDLTIDAFTRKGVSTAISAFKTGFNKVFPVEALCAYSYLELSVIFGSLEFNSELLQGLDNFVWTPEMLMRYIRVDHGYNMNSPVVVMFISWLSKLSQSDRCRFLLFVTGSPRLPPTSLLPTADSKTLSGSIDSLVSSNSNILGFGSLNPPLTIVLRHSQHPLKPDDYLPTVMTCANYIKLPNYSSYEILDKRWFQAMSEGHSSFHLS
ncbi:hypothetical protein BB558_000684 [Smittium angustum]|uniref:HECT-type E3 ubiquitin transferase n=1 Tax=Smittium angustum TaxID=133377 RepID=A0A2U1JDK2_SMIAN|nr:hypothetical protein BB558_000684 [Smittium angustum]